MERDTYTPPVSRLRDEYVEMRAEHFGFSDLYAAEWDRAMAQHDREVAARALRERLAENWRVFKKHSPAGAYLPVGQMDGDCRECGGAWPCAAVLAVVGQGVSAEALREARAEGWDRGHECDYIAPEYCHEYHPNPYRTRPSRQEPTTRGAGA